MEIGTNTFCDILNLELVINKIFMQVVLSLCGAEGIPTLGWAAQIREGLSEVAFLRTGHIFQ